MQQNHIWSDCGFIGLDILLQCICTVLLNDKSLRKLRKAYVFKTSMLRFLSASFFLISLWILRDLSHQMFLKMGGDTLCKKMETRCCLSWLGQKRRLMWKSVSVVSRLIGKLCQTSEYVKSHPYLLSVRNSVSGNKCHAGFTRFVKSVVLIFFFFDLRLVLKLTVGILGTGIDLFR